MVLATRRRVFCLSVLALACLLAPGACFADGVSWNVSGRWLLDGDGFAEKSFVRVSLHAEGDAELYTVVSGDLWYISGYIADVRLTASSLGINTWSDHMEETFSDRIPLPADLNPSVDDPFELPPVTTENGLTYKVTLTSRTGGKVAISGTTDMGSAGSVTVDSDSAIWKEGTPKPDIDTNKDSGCAAGQPGMAGLLVLLPFLFCGFRVK